MYIALTPASNISEVNQKSKTLNKIRNHCLQMTQLYKQISNKTKFQFNHINQLNCNQAPTTSQF